MAYDINNIVSYPVPITELTDVVRGDASLSKQYAIGKKYDGSDVTSGEEGYNDNSKYYKIEANKWADNPEDTPVEGSGASARYSSMHWAIKSNTSAINSDTSALKSEGHAVGEQGGIPVTLESPYYHNNSAYYAGKAKESSDIIEAHATAIDIIGDNISSINTVSSNISDVNTVAHDISNVNTVSGSISNVNTVGTNITNVNIVSSINSNVTTVATDRTNVDTVANNITDVNTVAGISGKVSAVADNNANVSTVANNIANVNTVAGISSNVTTVATDISNIDTTVQYLQNIIDAPTYALKSEGYAVGTQDGVPVSSGSEYYNNNAKYYNDNVVSMIQNKANKVASATQGHVASLDSNGDLADSGIAATDIVTKSADIVNALDSTATNKALSANMGKSLGDRTTTLETKVTTIEGKIPNQATSSNQLADKNFVNSSIATNTSNYISDNGNPFTSVDALEAYVGPPAVTNNDYAFVVGIEYQNQSYYEYDPSHSYSPGDFCVRSSVLKKCTSATTGTYDPGCWTDQAGGNSFYDRYKASVSGGIVTWSKEYRLNNSSFTSDQWAAINSNITDTLTASLVSHLADASSANPVVHVTSAERTAWNGNYTKPTGGIPKADLDSSVQTSLGKADSALQTTDILDVLNSTSTTDALSANMGKKLNDEKYQKPSTGIPKSDLASGVQSSLDKADAAVQSVSVLDNHPTLAWNTQSTVATITVDDAGTSTATDIHVTLPANPNVWKQNTASQEGYVPASSGKNKMAWMTDANGDPDWRAVSTNTAGSNQKASAKLFVIGAESQTTSDGSVQTYSNSNVYIDTSDRLVSKGSTVLNGVTNGSGSPSFGSSYTVGTLTDGVSSTSLSFTMPSLPSNAAGVAGIVSGPDASTDTNKAWMTNGSGVPAWRTVSTEDTKNTTGATNKANTKLFLVGAETQGDNPVTYSNTNVYIGTDNNLYSNGAKVINSVTNGGNTASFGQSVTVGTVGGTNLTFTMPADPAANKATRPSTKVNGNLTSMDANGDLVNSGISATSVSNHLSSTSNPHSVTKSQVGLGNVDNTSDANKPISTATQNALNAKQDDLGLSIVNGMICVTYTT